MYPAKWKMRYVSFRISFLNLHNNRERLVSTLHEQPRSISITGRNPEIVYNVETRGGGRGWSLYAFERFLASVVWQTRALSSHNKISRNSSPVEIWTKILASTCCWHSKILRHRFLGGLKRIINQLNFIQIWRWRCQVNARFCSIIQLLLFRKDTWFSFLQNSSRWRGVTGHSSRTSLRK